MSYAQDLLEYLETSPTAAHAVQAAAHRLADAGFFELREGDSWDLGAGDAFFVRRGRGALLTGVVGIMPPAEAGFRVVGTHADVPALRLKPNAPYAKEGYRQLGVEVYGGPILATWTDRDLTLAGYLVLSDQGRLREEPVHLKRPICRIPNAALHFNRGVNEDGLKLDKQKHLPPIYGLTKDDKATDGALRVALAEAAGVEPAAIVDYCLDLVDAQPPALGGLGNELLFARGIDNLVSCHAAIVALAEQRQEQVGPTRLVVLFDSEEVGSNTARGASSTLLDVVLERLCFGGENPREDLLRSISRSRLVSADGAHALHPNYADFHDPQHKIRLGGGPVIKVNANERYATTAESRAYLKLCAEAAGVPAQLYVHRTDLPCGSTIGPISATRLGLPTVDVGAPMLAMHSIRETTAAADCEMLSALLAAHLRAKVE
ncbi:MAG: M18 family aminopeptidase [Myxococcales bacterium]|nr:M18 family aminopeptidase [Myxococcales bacterium]